MSYRFMRIMIFFDLPTTEKQELKDYREFRRFLIKNGFMMLQESVYVKMLLNTTTVNNFIVKLKDNLPKQGLVQALIVTEKQFQSIHTLVGEHKSELLDSDERIVIF
ncbi:CRISPR-associated endonuclease Cas2 [Sneathia vaginalis]|uniref:CRISPR-associated endonuclease Cas2 n=2 Tax=Sneathia TaxID=168808 RepID=UPI00372D7C1E